jgi:tRNA-dihydrouridine synthase C
MQGVGDRSFRKAMASIGGFDEAIMDFIRVPKKAHVTSLCKAYLSEEISPIPLIPQIMGSDPHLMTAVALELEKKGALRIDINCGCPSNTVNVRGAGATLLKDTRQLYQVVSSVVKGVSVPVSVKMRSGYEDTVLFRENILALQESGVQSLTLHPRTKKDGYLYPANWDLIAEAKDILRIPVIGNGDIISVEDALLMLQQTKCDGLMIGRGAIMNPFLFRELRSHFSNKRGKITFQEIQIFLQVFISLFPLDMSMKVKVSKMKQLLGYVFQKKNTLIEKRATMLSSDYKDVDAFLSFALPLLQEGW